MRFVSLCLSAAAVLTAACESSMIHKTQRFSSDQSLVTSADVRVVHKINADNYVGGRFRPTTITCAEPSPDIAKAVSSSFDLAGSFGLGGLPSNIKPEAAAAISLARAGRHGATDPASGDDPVAARRPVSCLRSVRQRRDLGYGLRDPAKPAGRHDGYDADG